MVEYLAEISFALGRFLNMVLKGRGDKQGSVAVPEQ